jgi:radical SAM protein with 4Fe4S-binding SPASM domain
MNSIPRAADRLGVRARNRGLNLLEYREGRAVLRSLPRFLVVELTRGCNLTCPMCRDHAISPGHQRMHQALYDRIVNELAWAADLVDLRGWGESLILPDIIPRMDAVAATGAELRFVTNLSFRRDAVLAALAEHNCHVAVSVDTSDDAVFWRLRRGARLSLVSANLHRLVDAYVQAHGTAARIHLTVTVQRPALESLETLADWASAHGIGEMRLFGVTVPDNSELSLAGVTTEVDAALARLATRAAANGVTVVAGTTLGSLPLRPPDTPPCLHPWAYVYIAYDGRVGFCDHLIGPAGDPYILGDLTTTTFEAIWNSEAWQALRLEHVQGRRASAPHFDECAWCYRHRHIDFEHLFVASEARHRVLLGAAPLRECSTN